MELFWHTHLGSSAHYAEDGLQKVRMDTWARWHRSRHAAPCRCVEGSTAWRSHTCGLFSPPPPNPPPPTHPYPPRTQLGFIANHAKVVSADRTPWARFRAVKPSHAVEPGTKFTLKAWLLAFGSPWAAEGGVWRGAPPKSYFDEFKSAQGMSRVSLDLTGARRRGRAQEDAEGAAADAVAKPEPVAAAAAAAANAPAQSEPEAGLAPAPAPSPAPADSSPSAVAASPSPSPSGRGQGRSPGAGAGPPPAKGSSFASSAASESQRRQAKSQPHNSVRRGTGRGFCERSARSCRVVCAWLYADAARCLMPLRRSL